MAVKSREIVIHSPLVILAMKEANQMRLRHLDCCLLLLAEIGKLKLSSLLIG